MIDIDLKLNFWVWLENALLKKALLASNYDECVRVWATFGHKAEIIEKKLLKIARKRYEETHKND